MSHKPDPVEALHGALLASPLGIAGGARSIGRSAQVLYNKFSESMANELTGREERALADAVGGEAYVQAVCAYFGGVFFRLPDGSTADDDLLETYLAIVQKMGELSADLTQARNDGVIEPHEFERLRADGHATMAAIQTLLAELATMVRELPVPSPVPLRRAGGR